ncbi:MAG: metal ABC transporter ATP-binding protein [Candidatus Methanoperedens sp.]|nr:metal ABC transporter ATP-binding protein [Candidatus Methanoperedens sp.]
MGEKIIEIANINFDSDDISILEDINLVIERGDFLGIIGPNGSGKTTLLKIMLGLIKPKNGTVKLFGENIHHFKDWHRIGYVAQHAINFDVNFPLSAFEVVSMGRFSKKGLLRNLDKKDLQIIEDALEIVGMKGYKNKRIGELSGGEKQRVFIARALASEPELLILDEPTACVDVRAQKDFYDFLEKLNKERKITLVLVTHDIGTVTSRVGKLACMNKRLYPGCHPEEFFAGAPIEGMKVVHHLHGE